MPPENETEQNFEEIARTDGWVPAESWKGPADRWVDAKTFVERGAQILPIVQAKNRHLVETVESLTKKVGELEEGSSLFREYHEKTLAREQKERERVIAELETLRAKAVTEGDGQTFVQTEARLKELRTEEPVKTAPRVSTETQGWLNDNAWYNTDPALQAIADGLSDLVKKENPTLKGRAFLDKLTERVKAEMPHKFVNPRRTETVTETQTMKAGQKKGRSFDDLPQDAKEACAMFVRTIKGFTPEKYLESYRWD
jgi:hypothetical protein